MTGHRTNRTFSTLLFAASVGLLAAPAAGASPAGPLDKAPVAFGAAAWGSTVKVAPPLIGSGRSAFASLGCTQSSSKSQQNSSAGVDIAGLAELGAVASSVQSSSGGGGTYASEGRSTTQSSLLLDGRIEVGVIEAVATASRAEDGYHAAVEVTIASLSVDGVDVTLTGDEQQVDVAGIAEITVARERTTELARQSRAQVTAVTVRLLDSGAVIKLGEARASIDGRNVNATFAGGAYGSTVQAADGLTSGRTAHRPLGCVGTQGKDVVNEVATVDVGQLGTSSNVVSTVNAVQLPTPSARVSNRIEDVSLLGGLVRIKGLTAAVHVTELADGSVSYDTDGTAIGSIRVAGLTVAVPNKGGSVVLPAVGTLTFGAATELAGGRGVEVSAARIHLDLTDTDVVLGHAAAAIK